MELPPESGTPQPARLQPAGPENIPVPTKKRDPLERIPSITEPARRRSIPDGPPTPVPGKVLKEVVPGFETRQIQGFTVLLSTQAIEEGTRDHGLPFKALNVEFDGLVEVLNPQALKALRQVLIWVEWDRIDREHPLVLAKYYGGNVWHVDPSAHALKSDAIELLSLRRLTDEKELAGARTRLVLLHELSHAVHHLLLGDDHAAVRFAYQQAMDRHLYEMVPTERGDRVRAYAATNAHEYFAELTCAYLDRCFFYPFKRSDLKEYDPTGYALVESVWGRAGAKKSAVKKPR
jgi:hypothetical protein